MSNPTAFFKKLAKEKREQNIDKVHFQVIDSESHTENYFEWEVNQGHISLEKMQESKKIVKKGIDVSFSLLYIDVRVFSVVVVISSSAIHQRGDSGDLIHDG